MPDKPWDLRVGDEIGGCKLLTELGEGAYARVFRAYQDSMSRLIVLKVSDQESREPDLLASLDHRHIVRVYHYDDTRPGMFLLYMEYTPSCSLDKIIADLSDYAAAEKSGRLLRELTQRRLGENTHLDRRQLEPSIVDEMDWPTTVCWIGTCLADALRYAHGKHVLHRDVKPENILLVSDGSTLLFDFNVGVRLQSGDSSSQTLFGESLPYMSPEYVEALEEKSKQNAIGTAADVYSLAAVLWELLTGHRISSDQLLDIRTAAEFSVHHRTNDRTEGLQNVPDGSPADLLWVIHRCLDQDFRKRLDAAEMARRLSYFSLPELRPLTVPRYSTWIVGFPNVAVMLNLLGCAAVCLAPNCFSLVLLLGYSNLVLMKDCYSLSVWDETFAMHIQTPIMIAVGFLYSLCVPISLLWPVIRLMPTLERDLPKNRETQRIATRCLLIGPVGAIVPFSFWVFLSFSMPLWNQWGGEGAFGVADIARYVVVCMLHGLLAVPLTFYLIDFCCVHFLLLRLIPRSEMIKPRRLIHTLRSLVTVGRPVLITAILSLFLVLSIRNQLDQRYCIALVAYAFISFMAASWIEPIVLARLEAVEKALTPVRELLTVAKRA